MDKEEWRSSTRSYIMRSDVEAGCDGGWHAQVWAVRQGPEGTKLYCDPNLCPAVPRMKQG